MRLRETTVARLGLVALAIALWRHAALLIFDGIMPRYPVTMVLLALVYGVSFCALLVGASSSERAAKLARYSMVAFVIVVVVIGFRDGVRKASSDFLPTNDGHVFMDMAARYLLHGKNPYTEGLADAFRVYRMPTSFSTPLLDGDFSDRQAYPALSFLALVPALIAHVPSYFVYAAAFIGAMAIAIQKAPWWIRPFVVAAFAVEETYGSFAFGGVADNVWLFLLVGAIVWWRKRPTAAAILIGLACAYKQHPWFLVPLLLIRIGYDHGERPWGRASRRFTAIVAGVFFTINAPFIVWGPRAWFAGITEPLFAPMVQLSDGFTALSMTGWIPLSRAGTSLVFWSLYALTLFAYARHTRALRDWCWVVPGVVLWFGYRALMSYWFFFAILALVAMLVRGEPPADADREESAREASWRPVGIAAALLAAGIAGFIGWSATRPPAFGLFVAGTTQAWDVSAFKLRVRVENRLARTVMPQFWLQSTSMQPLPWSIEAGSRKLEPGQGDEYEIRAPHPFSEFNVTTGARLEVHDRTDPGQRAFVTIPAERSIHLPDAIPNPWFNVIETRTGAPTGWSFESTDAKLTIGNNLGADERVRFDFASDPAASAPPALATCVAAQHVGEVATGSRRAVLSTVLPLPEGTLGFHVNVPVDANRAPYELLYGVEIAVRGAPRDGRVLVLFGDDVARGTLPTGETFTSLPVTRGAWTTVSLRPRELLERLGVPLYMSRYQYARTSALDFPSTPVEVGLFATALPDQASVVRFGRIDQSDVRPTEQLAQHPSAAGLAAWRAEINLDNGNYAKAAQELEIASAAEPTTDRVVRLGDTYLLEKDFVRARDTYSRAFASTGAPEAEEGLGLALIELGDLAGAQRSLEHSRDFYKGVMNHPRHWRYLNALRGLMRIHALEHDCAVARTYRDALAAETPGVAAPVLAECP